VVTPLHDDEIPIDEELVRSLLATLSPAYDCLTLARFESSGSTNALFRLGDDLLVRVPRQPGGTVTIEKEQRWLPYVAAALPVAVPEIVAVGAPSAGYPVGWSVVRFLTGDAPGLPATDEPPRLDLARDLAAVVSALRGLAVTPESRADPALQWYRGGPLADLDEDIRRLLRECRELDGLDLDLVEAERAWDGVLALPAAHDDVPPRWYHGDLLAENLLVADGRLSAVLDFGALSVGNPAVDLVVAWELLDPAARAEFRRRIDADDAAWDLARGWALALGLMTFPYYWHTMPARCVVRLRMTHEVLAEL
jgi:aminoglycoside phosphotransferase (APT) family kinase protein